MHDDAHSEAAEPFGPLGRRLLAVCKVAAVAGTLVFTALVVMSIVSITGRKLWSLPVPGDVELLQLCAAVAALGIFWTVRAAPLTPRQRG